LAKRKWSLKGRGLDVRTDVTEVALEGKGAVAAILKLRILLTEGGDGKKGKILPL
jgi:hypothetical protein